MTLLIFDIDGTLTNTKEIDDRCFIESLKECWGCNVGEVDWSVYPNVTDTGLSTDIYKNFFIKEINEAELTKLKKIFSSKIITRSETFPEAFQEIKGATQFIKEIQSKDFAISIATGGWKITAEHKLKQINIDLNDFAHATSDDHFARNEIVKKSIDRAKDHYGRDFDKIIYFGDGLWDFEACCQLNIGFIGIDSNKNGKLKNAGAAMVFEDYIEIDSIIKVLLKYKSTGNTI